MVGVKEDRSPWLTITVDEAKAILDQFSSNNNWDNFVYYDNLDSYLIDVINDASPATEIEIARKGQKFVNIEQNADGQWQLVTQLGVHHIYDENELSIGGMTLMDVYIVDLVPLYEDYLFKFI